MEKLPRLPSKSESHAKIRCQAEEKRLSSKKGELDKVLHTHTRHLLTHRLRFLVDRRRSMGQVFNSQLPGRGAPHRRRKGDPDLDPEMIDIFRRQAERRKSVKVIEDAVAADVMERLEKRYLQALEEGRSGSGGGDSVSDSEVGVAESLLDAPPLEVRQGGRRHGRRRESLPTSLSSITARRKRPVDAADPTDGGRFESAEERYDDDTDYDATQEILPPFAAVDLSEDSSEVFTTGQTRPMRVRKRSYSDGNITPGILESQMIPSTTTSAANPYILAKAATAAAAGSSADDEEEDSSEDDLFAAPTTKGEPQEAPDSSTVVGISRNETFVIETDVTESPLTRRRGAGVSFHLPLQSPRGDATMLKSDVTTLRSDVTLSPSQHRRRGKDSSPPTEDVAVSPSPRRRLAKADASDKKTNDAGKRRSGAEALACPWPAGEARSPCGPRRARKDASDKPKPIYQASPSHRDPSPFAAAKRRPLRRSRSEAVDLSALITSRAQRDFHGVRAPSVRRGSDSLQELGGGKAPDWNPRPPKSWNSLMYGLALTEEEREEIARHKRRELVTSLRKRQEEVDSDVSRRIRTFLQRYDEV